MLCLDKTGTITSGEPRVTDILPAEGVTEAELLAAAAALEKKSEHPLARAILQLAGERSMEIAEVEGFEAKPGSGLVATLAGDALAGGNLKFISAQAAVPAALRTR